MSYSSKKSPNSEKILISSGSPFEEMTGYSRAVAFGEEIHVSGTTGYDYSNMTISEDTGEQADQCFKNIKKALEMADFEIEDIVCLRTYFPNRSDWPAIAEVISKWCNSARPTSTAVVCGLVDEEMKVEIEAYARRTSAK
jgi:enamine deaminase RidA (YjgF/YER057c/UK114 family)